VSYFADPSDVQGITGAFATLLPGDAYAILDSQINSVLSAPPINASFGIVLSLGFAFISAGAGIRAMMRAMNVAYEEVESRNPALFFVFGMLMTLGSLIFVWISLFVIIGVSAALAHTNFEHSASFTTRTLPWILLITVFCFACGVMYRFGPSRRPARKRWVFPGIAFALFSWLAISFASAAAAQQWRILWHGIRRLRRRGRKCCIRKPLKMCKNDMLFYEYSVWFQDRNLLESDQGHEWVACFIVASTSQEKAKAWGDKLSNEYSTLNPNNGFVSSRIKRTNESNLPIVEFGTKPSDEYIGW